jgi:hypothetical protein
MLRFVIVLTLIHMVAAGLVGAAILFGSLLLPA